MSDGDGAPTVGELARGLRDVLVRFEGLIQRIEIGYISKDVYTLGQELLRAADSALKTAVENEAKERESCDEELRRRISNLEDNQKWLVRAVIGMVLAAVIGGVLLTKGHVGQ